ncbi:hypothetical protein FGB62_98g038 [Gracilaria domingensis]|nr:hypothetical protein FGB62_98g038 [Gracilaria domingensis]
MTPDSNANSRSKSQPAEHKVQSLQETYDALRSLEEKTNESKRLFEREFQLQKLLNAELSKQLAARTKPIHALLGTSSSLINAIQDEDALWSEAAQMANLSHQLGDTQFSSVLREGERIIDTVMNESFDKLQVTNAIDDLIRALEAT